MFAPGISRPGISREKVVSKIPVSRDFYARVPGNIVVLLKPLFGGVFALFPPEFISKLCVFKDFFSISQEMDFLSFLHDYFV